MSMEVAYKIIEYLSSVDYAGRKDIIEQLKNKFPVSSIRIAMRHIIDEKIADRSLTFNNKIVVKDIRGMVYILKEKFKTQEFLDFYSKSENQVSMKKLAKMYLEG